MKNKVVFILGATAVGKSDFGIKLAKKFDGEIISADSVQIYRGLDIGSAKQLDTCSVKHHLIDILEPEENFSVFEFVELTKQKIKEINSQKKLPIVVGGTGLYIKALCSGYNFGGANKDEKFRESLEKYSTENLFEMLEKENPTLAENIDRFNRVRVVRALEISRANGEKTIQESDIEPLVFILELPREKMYDKINRRVDIMVKNGLIEEVESLKKRGLTENNQSMKAIGYKEVLQFLNGQISKEEMIDLVKQHTRNYAKRQVTFLKKIDGIKIDVENSENALKVMEDKTREFLK